MPRAAVLISGVYDLTMRLSMEYLTERNTVFSSKELLEVMKRLYEKDGHLSPLVTWKNANERILQTKLMVVYSKDEEFTQENVEFVNLLKERGADVEVMAEDMMIHVFPYMAWYFPEARVALDRILDFVER